MHTDLGSWLAEGLSEGLKLPREPPPSEEPKRAEDGREELPEDEPLRFEHLVSLRSRAHHKRRSADQ